MGNNSFLYKSVLTIASVQDFGKLWNGAGSFTKEDQLPGTLLFFRILYHCVRISVLLFPLINLVFTLLNGK